MELEELEAQLKELQAQLEKEREAREKIVADYNALQDEINKRDVDKEVEQRLQFRLGLQELKQKYPDADVESIEGATLEEVEAKAKAIQEKIDAKVAEREARLREEFSQQWGSPIGGGEVVVTPNTEEIEEEFKQAKEKKDLKGMIAAIRKRTGLNAWLNSQT